MIAVYICSVHGVARTSDQEPWDKDKYEKAVFLSPYLRLVETSCHRCMHAVKRSFISIWDEVHA